MYTRPVTSEVLASVETSGFLRELRAHRARLLLHGEAAVVLEFGIGAACALGTAKQNDTDVIARERQNDRPEQERARTEVTEVTEGL